jgi:hypothetical protein
MLVALLTVKLVAGVPPKETEVAPVNAVPVSVIVVAPVVGPAVAPRLVIAGSGAELTVTEIVLGSGPNRRLLT